MLQDVLRGSLHHDELLGFPGRASFQKGRGLRGQILEQSFEKQLSLLLLLSSRALAASEAVEDPLGFIRQHDVDPRREVVLVRREASFCRKVVGRGKIRAPGANVEDFRSDGPALLETHLAAGQVVSVANAPR